MSVSALPLVWDPTVCSSSTVCVKQQQNNGPNPVNLYIQQTERAAGLNISDLKWQKLWLWDESSS